MRVYDREVLDLVVRDVLGLINHETHPLEMRTGHQLRHAQHLPKR